MARRRPPLSALRTFEAAAHWESFAKAADDLCVSQSAVSQQIRILEDWLQVALFTRLGNRVALTDEGRAFGSRLSEAFEIIDEACAQTLRSQDASVIRVEAEAAFASRWLRPRLAAFRAANSGIDLDLRAGGEPGASGPEGADIVVHFEKRLNETAYSVDRLFPIDGYPACAPSFLDKHPQIRAPADLCAFPLIHDNSRMVWRRWFDRFVPGDDAWRSGYVYSDLSLAIHAAVDGEGVFLADDLLCAQEMAAGALVKALPETLRCAWYCIAVNRERAGTPSVRVFHDWLQDTAAREFKR